MDRRHRGRLVYVPEIDPTPFAITDAGTFRGLPSTYTGAGDSGFTLVTPMIVTTDLPVSLHNVRAVAKLRIDFTTTSVPIRGALVLAISFVMIGMAQLRRQRRG